MTTVLLIRDTSEKVGRVEDKISCHERHTSVEERTSGVLFLR